jgi:hypothetical protein
MKMLAVFEDHGVAAFGILAPLRGTSTFGARAPC